MKNHEMKDKYYVKFNTGQQTIFLKSVKENNFVSWDQLANFLGVHRNMIFCYLSEKSKLPLCNFKKIIQTSNINTDPSLFKIVLAPNYKSVNIPVKFTTELAEIIGIVLGDGCIYQELHRNRFQTIITSHKEELKYVKYIKNIFEKYFNYKFCIIEKKNCLVLENCSVFVGSQLIKAGLFAGNKIKNKVKIPSWAFKNNNFLTKTIRGLFDTDGCVYRKYNQFAQIQFKFGCLETTNSLHKAIKKLNFNPTRIQRGWNGHKNKTYWKFYLSRQKEIDKFFKEIKPKNSKHINRYKKIRNGDAAI